MRAETPAGALSRQRAGACADGQTMDSAYVVRKAAEAFASDRASIDLVVTWYEAVVAPGPIEEGILVRLLPRRPQAGGGGLVYVDGESGCAIALKAYE